MKPTLRLDLLLLIIIILISQSEAGCVQAFLTDNLSVAVEGDTVRLPCPRTNYPHKPVDWKYKRTRAASEVYLAMDGHLKDISPKFELNSTDYTLTLHNVTTNFTGLYFCTEDVGLGEKYFTFVLVENHACPRNCSCTFNDTSTMNCSGSRLSQLPDPLPTFIVEFIVSNNSISVIRASDFDGCVHLQSVDLSMNRLSSVDKDSFSSNVHLKKLYLNDNNLTYDTLSPKLFITLRNLEELNIANNNWQKTHDYNHIMFSSLENLKILSVDGIRDAPFGIGFSGLRSLESLTIIGGLNNVKNDTFASLSASPVRFVTIHNNSYLHSLEPGSFKHFHRMESLELSCNRELGVDNAADGWWSLQFTNITRLRITKSTPLSVQATTVTEKFFKYLERTRIEILQIDHNDIITIAPHISYSLPELRHLDLSYNRFTNIASFIFDIWKLKRLEYVDGRHQASRYVQSGKSEGEEMHHRRKRSSKIDSDIDSGDWWSGCQTPILQPCAKSNFQAPVIDAHGKAKEFPLPDNETWCVPVAPRLKMIRLSDTVNMPLAELKQVIFFGGQNLARLDYKGNGFGRIVGPIVFTLPPTNLSFDLSDNLMSCLSPDTLKISATVGLVVTEFILSGNDLSRQLRVDVDGDTFRYVRNLTRLTLADNGITTLPYKIFRHLHSLRILDLSQNFLQTIEFDFSHMHQLYLLNMSNNKITNLLETTLSQLSTLIEQQHTNNSSLKVALLGNRIECSCESIRFLEWLNSNEKVVSDFANLSCVYKASDADFRQLDVIIMELRELCSRSRFRVVIFIVSCAVGLAFFVVPRAWRRHKRNMKLYRLKTDNNSVIELQSVSARGLLETAQADDG